MILKLKHLMTLIHATKTQPKLIKSLKETLTCDRLAIATIRYFKYNLYMSQNVVICRDYLTTYKKELNILSFHCGQ